MGAGKVILGLILVLIGLWLILPSSWNGFGLWQHLLIVLLGIVPIVLVLAGLLIIWVESEELKTVKPEPKPRKRK
jgi:uncharacterized membrane protein